MAPSKWEDEDSSTPPSSPPQPAIARRTKFDDEEDDSDVADNWDEAEDSEVEREKAKKAAEAKAKADAEAAKNKKSKAQRIEERRVANMRAKTEGDDLGDDDSSESETEKRARLRRTEQDADLKHAEDLFGNLSVGKKKGAPKSVTADPNNPGQSIDLALLPLFNPTTKGEFATLRETLSPLLADLSKKAHYTLFLQDFAKDIAKDLPSEQIKKIASSLTALSNEKMKEEKAAEKGGKKTKAAKTKATLVANRDASAKADTTSYTENDLEEDDFM